MVRKVTVFNGFETCEIPQAKIRNIHKETDKHGIVVEWGIVIWRGRAINVRNNGPNGWSGRTM